MNDDSPTVPRIVWVNINEKIQNRENIKLNTAL